MSPARRTGLLICSALFRFMLLATISMAVIAFSFGDPKLIKRSLIETKAYDRVVPSIIATNNRSQLAGSLPLDDPNIQVLINRDFSPNLLQKNSEQFIDAMYRWLDGKTVQPQFRLDFSGTKLQFANDLGTYEVQRLASLPVCRTYSPSVGLDPFHATCRPKGIQLAGQDQEIAATITGSDAFLPKSVFTAKDFPKNAQGVPITERLNYVPLVFQLIYPLTWLAAAVTLLLGVGLVSLRTSRSVGWRSLGLAILVDGLFLTVTALVFGLLLPHVMSSFPTQFATTGMQTIFNDVAQNIAANIESLLINIGIQVSAVGLVIVAAERIMRSNTPFRGIERFSGLVSGVGVPKIDRTKLIAADIPVQSSESNNRRAKNAKRSKKTSAAKKEIA